jgi:hypothetical protein
MTNATHTQGPWTIEPLQITNGADIAICAPNSGYIVAVVQHDPDIQTCDNPDGDSVKFHPSDISNARLIAAAPDLLAALEHVDAYLAPQGDEEDVYNYIRAIIKGAISKAQGA